MVHKKNQEKLKIIKIGKNKNKFQLKRFVKKKKNPSTTKYVKTSF